MSRSPDPYVEQHKYWQARTISLMVAKSPSGWASQRSVGSCWLMHLVMY